MFKERRNWVRVADRDDDTYTRITRVSERERVCTGEACADCRFACAVNAAVNGFDPEPTLVCTAPDLNGTGWGEPKGFEDLDGDGDGDGDGDLGSACDTRAAGVTELMEETEGGLEMARQYLQGEVERRKKLYALYSACRDSGGRVSGDREVTMPYWQEALITGAVTSLDPLPFLGEITQQEQDSLASSDGHRGRPRTWPANYTVTPATPILRGRRLR